MGRFFLSNQSEWIRDAEKRHKELGFKDSCRKKEKTETLISFHMLNVKNENKYVDNNGDYIVTNGTVIYDGKFGVEGLKKLLFDLKVKSIKEVRSNLFGNYAIIYKINDIIRIFIDEAGTFGIYYFSKNDKWIISDTFYHVQKYARQGINFYGGWEYVCNPGIEGNQSPFENVFRLLGDECIRIEQGKTIIEECPTNEYTYEISGFDDAVEQLSNLIIKYMKVGSKISQKNCLFMTGGVDSRMLLAALLNIGETPVISNYQGNSFDMNSKKEDMEISKAIADALGLDYRFYNVKEDIFEKNQNADTNLIEKFGEHAFIYGGTKKYFDIFERGEFYFWYKGIMGEVLRDFEALDVRYKAPFSLRDYSDDLMIYQYGQFEFLENEKITVDGYKDYVYAQIRECANKLNINHENLDKTMCHKMYIRHMIHADGLQAGLHNIFGYFPMIYTQKEILDFAMSVPYEFKRNKKLILAVTNRLYPKLNNMEYYTRCHYMKYDSKQGVLVEKEPIGRQKLRNMLYQNNFTRNVMIQRSKRISKQKNEEYRDIISDYVDRINKTTFMKSSGVAVDFNSFQISGQFAALYNLSLIMDKVV